MYTLWTHNYKSFKLLSQANDTILEFQGADKAGKAFVGDTVALTDEKCVLVKRTQHPKLAGVLQLNSKTIYGMTSRGAPIYLFTPFDRRYPSMRVGCSEKDRSVNRICLVDFADWPEKELLPRANLDRVLGVAGDFAVEKAALAHTASPWCKPTVLGSQQNRRIGSPSRKHLDEGWNIINIDPEGCRDIDDIICMKQNQGNTWTIIIGISDLTDWVKEDDVLDLYARRTLQTIYDGGRAIKPMLPEAYSESLFSLVPGSPRQIIGLMVNYIPENDVGFRITDVEFGTFSVVNKRSYTYDTIRDADDFPVATLASFVEELAERPLSDTHDWVAELMIFYNLRAAELIAGKGGVLRVHSGPKAERLQGLDPVLAERLASVAAKYDVQGVHYGFGWKPYVQVTSPIRRYCDMYNQRILVKVLNEGEEQQLTRVMLEQMNWSSKVAKQFERSVAFMSALETPCSSIETIVLDTKDDKTRLWVPSWSTIINVKSCLKEIGSTVKVKYFYNAGLVHWKERMVFSVCE